MSIVLIGPPGARVSETAQALATRLGTIVRDTDQEVEQQAGKPVSDIFLEDGEAAFRDLERAVAVRALADNSKKSGGAGPASGEAGPASGEAGPVVALGSGAVLDQAVREQLKDSTVVYLAADFRTVVKQAGLDQPRVVLPGNPRGRLRAMLEERARTYESLATVTIQSEDASGPDDLAEQIEQAITR
jgi:shikimate kinase